jgi:HK97 family phage prohead protease
MNKEYRSAIIAAEEKAEENQLLVSGYAAVIEQPTVICEIDGVQYFEVIDKDAFLGCDMSNVPFKYNHSDDFLVLARTRNKTLSLVVDNKGLFISANLAPVQAGKDLYGLIQRGDIDKMSFGFTVGQENYDSQIRTRRILKIDKLWDVSAVDTPAYDGTSIDIADGAGISARDYFTAQVEMEKKLIDEEKRKRLYLLTF